VAQVCHPAGMTPSARKVTIIVCVAVSGLVVLCGLPIGVLVWAAYNTETPVQQEVGAAAPGAASTPATPPAETSSPAAPVPPTATTAAATAPSAGFDRAAWDTYWTAWAQTSYGRHVTDVTWNGIAFIAHTDLVADADAKSPATQICMAVAGFWAPDFRPIQVYDRADTVLVSRRTVDETCTWRR